MLYIVGTSSGLLEHVWDVVGSMLNPLMFSWTRSQNPSGMRERGSGRVATAAGGSHHAEAMGRCAMRTALTRGPCTGPALAMHGPRMDHAWAMHGPMSTRMRLKKGGAPLCNQGQNVPPPMGETPAVGESFRVRISIAEEGIDLRLRRGPRGRSHRHNHGQTAMRPRCGRGAVGHGCCHG